MLASFNPYGPAEVYPGMVLTQNGGLVHFVHSSGAAGLDLLPPGMAAPTPGSFQLSIQAAGALCRANRGDQIVVLPGHVETVAVAGAWSTMPAGVTIRGQGNPGSNQRPTINFTAAASTITLAANTVLDNFQIFCDATAATVVAAPFTIAAAGVQMTRLKVRVATSATQLATAPVTVAAGADDFFLGGCHLYSAGAGTFATNPTNHVLVSGAVQRCWMVSNRFYGGTAAATGLIQFSAAATDCFISDNRLVNTFATSTGCIVGFAGVTGMVEYCNMQVGNNGTASSQGILVPGSWGFTQNFCDDEVGKSGLLSPLSAT